MNHWNRLSLLGALLAGSLVALTPGPAFAKPPLPGKYKGETGDKSDDGRISFKVDRSGRKISKLNVSAFVLCQDTAGNARQFSIVATNTDKKKFRMSASGRFKASGQDKNGIRFKVEGKAKGSKKMSGTVELSQARTFSTIFFPFIDSELCSGSRNWKAKR